MTNLDKPADLPPRGQSWRTHAATLAIVAACTLVGFLMVERFDLANIVMVYLLGVAYVSVRYGRAESLIAAILGVALFDVCFVPPRGKLAVHDAQYLVTFGIMLAVSVLISSLTQRLKQQTLEATKREQESHDATMLAEREQMRSSLLSSVSHDLRTPLASIEGAASGLLEQGDLSARSRELAATVVEESERMANLIRNLLDMSRFEGGDVQLSLDWESLEELIGSAVVRTERLFEQPVHAEVSSDLPLLRLDGVLIEQAIINLLENAARHGGRRVQAVITAAREADRAVVTVSDNGPGLPAGHSGELFGKFRRGGGSGFGLGLAICKAAIEAHGGSISASRSPSGGAKFIMELPISEDRSHA